MTRLLLASLALATTLAAQAQPCPDKNVMYWQAFPPGGESDLSAHVDFPALAAAASKVGAAVFGPTTQADFLEDLGAIQRIEQLATRHPDAAQDLRSRLDRLISPDQMGTLFKVLAIVPKTALKPPGF